MYTVCIQVMNLPKMGKPGVNIILQKSIVTNKNLLHQQMASISPKIMGFSDLSIKSRSANLRWYIRNSLETKIPNLKSVCSNSSPAWRYGNRRSTPNRPAVAQNRAANVCARRTVDLRRGSIARPAADPYAVDFPRFGAISGQTKP